MYPLRGSPTPGSWDDPLESPVHRLATKLSLCARNEPIPGEKRVDWIRGDAGAAPRGRALGVHAIGANANPNAHGDGELVKTGKQDTRVSRFGGEQG